MGVEGAGVAGLISRDPHPGEPWSIHLTTHGSPVPGVFRVYTTTGEARDFVLIVGSEAASGVTARRPHCASHGFLTVELEYAAIQDGPALLVESLQLSHGAVGFRLASLRQSAGEVHGVLEIAIPIAPSSAHLEVKAELAALYVERRDPHVRGSIDPDRDAHR